MCLYDSRERGDAGADLRRVENAIKAEDSFYSLTLICEKKKKCNEEGALGNGKQGSEVEGREKMAFLKRKMHVAIS